MIILQWYKNSFVFARRLCTNLISKVQKNLLLSLILLMAIILRFIAVMPGYHPYHGDETAIWGSALNMIRQSTLDPGRYDYPATSIFINAFFFKIFFIPIMWINYYLNHLWDLVDGITKIPPLKEDAKRIFALYIIGDNGVNAIFWARYVTAAFGVGTVFLTYLLSKKLFSARVGILAALFLTFNYRNVMNSHLALPDIYNAFFLLLALIFCWNLLSKPSLKNYLLSGVFCGLAFSVKYQIFAIVPFVFAHLYLTFKDGFNFKKLFDKRAVASGLAIIITFLLTNPFYFVHIEEAWASNLDDYRKYGFGTNSLNIFPISYLYHIDYGPIELLLVVIGFLVGLVRNKVKTLFLLCVILPILYVFLYYTRGGFYVRNFIIITPLFLVFASVAFWAIVEPITKRLNSTLRSFLIVLLVLLVIYVPASNSIISSYAYTQPWGYDILRPWIQANIPSDEFVIVHPFDRANLSMKNKSLEYTHDGIYSVAESLESGASYVVADLSWTGLPFYGWMNYGIDESSKLWGKPLGILKNTYAGIATNELFRYQIHTVSKPWQAPDTNFVVAKLPDWPAVVMQDVKKFSFDKDDEGWKIYGHEQVEEGKSGFDAEVGNIKLGSLFVSRLSGRFPTGRITSEPIEVKENHMYTVKGFLRTDRKFSTRERDGFLRLDFYSDNPDLEKLGIRTDVSSRVYDTDLWIEKEIIDVAPIGSKYMTISVSIGTGKMWIDDIVIKESIDEVLDPTTSAPYTKNFIDPNTIYPNSHGNL